MKNLLALTLLALALTGVTYYVSTAETNNLSASSDLYKSYT